MRLSFEQLPQHVSQPLRSVYLLSGDEPMQQIDAANQIRTAAREQDIHERELYQVDTKFNWNLLLEEGATMSLFATRKLVEIRLDKLPLKAGQTVLERFIEQQDEARVVVISCPKIPKRQESQGWVKAADRYGARLVIWPVEAHDLPQWLMRRAQQRQRSLTLESARFLAHQIQGNLLAARQELDKACLMTDEGDEIGLELLRQQSAYNARFTPWETLDAMHRGDFNALPQMLFRLREEQDPQMLLARALQREFLLLEGLARVLARQGDLNAALMRMRVFGPRQNLIRGALRRYRVQGWQRLWVRALALEKIVVGQAPGDFWDECLELMLLAAGKPVWRSNRRVTTSPSRVGAKPVTGRATDAAH